MNTYTKANLLKVRSNLMPIMVIAVIAVVIRVLDISSRWLWYDELQSVTHAILPLRDLIKSVQMYDPHPPFYYIQLYLWLLFGISDSWIKLNSVLWSVLAIVSLFVVSRNIFNTRVGILASALFAIFPYSVAYAQEARMYSLLMFLGIWNFFFIYQFLQDNQAVLMAVGIAVSTVTFLYSHGAGFMILFSGLSYALIYLVEENRNGWKQVLRWGLLQVGILVVYLPWMWKVRSINVGHTLTPSINDIIDTLFILVFGFGKFYPSWFRWIGVLLTVAIIIILVARSKTSRSVIIAYVIAPIVFCALTSYLIRPIWLHRTLAYIVPFLSLAIALIVSESFMNVPKLNIQNRLFVYGLFTVLGSFLLLTLMNQQLNYSHNWNFREAAKYVQKFSKEYDIIYIPYDRTFWGFNWYFIGPGSVYPLDKNYRLITENHISVLSKPSIDQDVVDGRNVWIVYRNTDDITIFEKDSQDLVQDFGYLIVRKHKE